MRPVVRWLWFGVAGLVAICGCGVERGKRPPRLARSYRLPERAECFAVGPTGRVYYVSSSFGARSSKNELRVVGADSKPGHALKLGFGVEIKAVVADGRGSLYLGVREGGKDQVWVFPENWGGDKPEPTAKLTPELPDDLNGLFLDYSTGELYALCGDHYVVRLRADGSVARTIELPGDSRPEDGGADKNGNLYIRRSSGPVVKVKPDGSVDTAWARSEAASLDYVRSVAVDPVGLVYVAASEGGVYLRAFETSGALRFNIVAKELEYAPDRLFVTRKGILYALDGDKVYEFRP